MNPHNNRLTAPLQPKPIERLVFSGGGAKGIVYSGAYKALIEAGLFKNINSIAGASAGALTATFLALGMQAEDFRKHLQTTNLIELMGSRVGNFFGKNLPGISCLTKDGKPLEHFIRTNINKTIITALNQLENLDKLKNNIDFNKVSAKTKESNPRITFADLAILNRLFPDQFKQLTMIAVQFPGGEVQIFNSELTPDVEIALACRASASIPVVLQPIEITINGKTHQYIDGGFYENVPTDYFDHNANGDFIPNTKPDQTLVFAFGEGIKNNKNQVFKALYGSRWDEVIADELILFILNEAIKQANINIDPYGQTPPYNEQGQALTHAIKLVMEQLVQNKTIKSNEAKIIKDALCKTIHKLFCESRNNQQFWQNYQHEQSKSTQLNLLIQTVKEMMRPVLYNPTIIEQLKRNVIVETLGDLHTPYKNTAQKEKSYQKLHADYPLRTIELRVGGIKTTDFNKATHFARVMDALGYLDTINHLTNHDLHDPECLDSERFFTELVDNFEKIVQATLTGQAKYPLKNALLNEINTLRTQLQTQDKDISTAKVSRQIFYIIKDWAEKKQNSPEATALARAIELHNKTLSSEQLFKEIYEEGFKHSGFFSQSNITGEFIFKNSTLHQSLKNKNMFALYAQQPEHLQETRTDKIFNTLSTIPHFKEDYQSWLKTHALTETEIKYSPTDHHNR